MSSINPEAKAGFKATAFSTENIKTVRDQMKGLTTCAHCWIVESEAGAPLKRCGKCKGSFYCSRQCQKADWESHKLICQEETSTFRRLKVNFLSNMYLMHLLEIWLILEFRLSDDPSRAANTPLLATMCVGIEPEDIRTTAKLLLSRRDGEDTRQRNITGMFQVDGIQKLPEEAGDPDRLELWRRSKEAFSAKGYSDYPVVIVEIVKGDDEHAMAASIPLHPTAFNAVRGGEMLVYDSGITGKKLERPMNTENVLNMLNHLIRADSGNQLLLRTKMTREDIQLIRDAQQLGAAPKNYVTMFRAKVTRELEDY